MPRTVTIGMVCHHGLMQDQAILLAASLRHFLRFEARVVAVVPTPAAIFGHLSKPIKPILDALDVEIIHVHNDYINPPKRMKKAYKGTQKARFFTNKWALLEHPWDTDQILFLDSDTVCTQPFEYADWMDHPLVLRSVGYGGARIAKKYTWQAIFGAVDAVPENTQVRHRFGVIGPPMFNGGLVGIDVAKACDFCRIWQDDTDRIHANVLKGKDRYFAEQAALSTAVTKSKLEFGDQPWGQRWQCKHYGTWQTVWRDERYLGAIRSLLVKYPAIRAFLMSRAATPTTRDYFRALT